MGAGIGLSTDPVLPIGDVGPLMHQAMEWGGVVLRIHGVAVRMCIGTKFRRRADVSPVRHVLSRMA
jgi:hypothetical protein